MALIETTANETIDEHIKNVAEETIENITEDSDVVYSEKVTENVVVVSTDEAVNETATVVVNEPAENDTTEKVINESDEYFDPYEDKGIGIYNPYMYCAISPVSDHKTGIAYIDEGYYIFDELGHCWKIDNPDLYSGAVGIVYNTCSTVELEDDILVLIMVDWPIPIECMEID